MQVISTTITGKAIGPLGIFQPNYAGSTEPWARAGGHMAVWTPIPADSNTYQAFLGHAGETTVERMVRLCGEESIPVDVIGTTVTTMGPQEIATLVSVLRKCEATEDGLMGDGRGPGLYFVTRSYRYNRAAAISPDMAADPPQVGDPFAPADDDQRNRNIIKVDRDGGSSATYEDTDGPLGTDEIQDYDSSVPVNYADDSGLYNRAAFEVRKGTVLGFRYPTLRLDLAATPALVRAWLAAGLADRIDVLNVTSKATQHPPGTVSLLLEGYSASLSPFDWELACNCSAVRAVAGAGAGGLGRRVPVADRLRRLVDHHGLPGRHDQHQRDGVRRVPVVDGGRRLSAGPRRRRCPGHLHRRVGCQLAADVHRHRDRLPAGHRLPGEAVAPPEDRIVRRPMSATLPTNFVPNHAPDAAEMGQVLSAITRITNIQIMSAIATASRAAYNGTSYADVSGTSAAWTKSADSSGSDVIVLAQCSMFSQTAVDTFKLGINIGGTDYDIANFQCQPINTRYNFVGFRLITGIAAGAYTPILRVKRTSGGTGTVAVDANDCASWLICEAPK